MRFFDKISAVLGLAGLLLVQPVFLVAQEVPDPQIELDKKADPLVAPQVNEPAGGMGAVRSNDELDNLFDELRKQTKTSSAQATAVKIWREWYQSGSANINLLMYYTSRAMNQKNYPAAIDLLDQITTLDPEFAEGWNRRATVHYYMGDFSRSLADIETTLSLEPRHFGALSGLAAILQRLDREEEALNTWYKVLKIYPANDSAQKAVIQLEEELAGSRT